LIVPGFVTVTAWSTNAPPSLTVDGPGIDQHAGIHRADPDIEFAAAGIDR
jgi:hypothetical protein